VPSVIHRLCLDAERRKKNYFNQKPKTVTKTKKVNDILKEGMDVSKVCQKVGQKDAKTSGTIS